jgi:hypothetical protein
MTGQRKSTVRVVTGWIETGRQREDGKRRRRLIIQPGPRITEEGALQDANITHGWVEDTDHPAHRKAGEIEE